MSVKSHQSAEVTDRTAMEAPPLSFALRSANAYFSIPTADTEKTSVGTSNMETLRQDKNLSLTGNIISATAYIPYVVGITEDGKFELTSRQDKSMMHKCLSYLSSSTTWNHTVVGWTGEILPALSAEFRALLKRTDQGTSSYERSQLGNVVIHGADSSGFNETFMQRVKDNNEARRSRLITKADRRALERLLQHVFKDTIIPIWLGEWSKDSKDSLILTEQSRWGDYAEETLYKNLHNDADGLQDKGQMYSDYKRRNEAMADAIMKVYMPGDIIWVHDYQLMLLPEILRRKLPSAHIAYFHHVNWCPKEMLVKLPEHHALMTGLLGASTIGVSRGGLRNYIADYYRQELRLAGAENGIVDQAGRHISLINVPVVSDVTGAQQAGFEDEKVETAMSNIRHIYENKKIIVARARLDRPDSTHFLLDSYEYLLDHHPDLKGNMVLFLIASQRKASGTTKAVDLNAVDQGLASRVLNISSKFASPTYQPIMYLSRNLPDSDYFALLRVADVGVMTSDHEDVNAMSMQYTVCQQELQNPLFISELCLKDDDPRHATIADSTVPSGAPAAAGIIKTGFSMLQDEKRNKHKAVYDYFAQQNATTFTEQFLTKACASFGNRIPFTGAPLLDRDALSASFRSAGKRLIMFDYDGTLTPIINDPDAAVPTEQLLSTFKQLSANAAKNHVWIISGRSRQFLEQQFGHISGVGLSAEHGCFVRRPNSNEWENLAATMDMGWKHEVEKVFMNLEKDIRGSWIERKEVAIVWHYRNATDHDACLAKATETKALLEVETLKSWDVEIMLGKANVEIRPRFLNKGVMAANLVKESFEEDEKNKFVLCAGDDTTDEDMFRALLTSRLGEEGVFSCLVAKEAKPSLAFYRIGEPKELVDAVTALSMN